MINFLIFIVDNISTGDPDTDFVGVSPINGPCNKDNKDWDGLVAGEVNRTTAQVARTFAHELGHYLGLSHNHDVTCPTAISDKDRLMAQTRCANSDCDSVILLNSEGTTICNHCAVKNGC